MRVHEVDTSSGLNTCSCVKGKVVMGLGTMVQPHTPRSIRSGSLPIGRNAGMGHSPVCLPIFFLISHLWFWKDSCVNYYCLDERQCLCGTLPLQFSLPHQVLMQLPIQVGAPIGRRTLAKGMALIFCQMCQETCSWAELSTLLGLEGKLRHDNGTWFGAVGSSITEAAFQLQAAARCVHFHLSPIVLKFTLTLICNLPTSGKKLLAHSSPVRSVADCTCHSHQELGGFHHCDDCCL